MISTQHGHSEDIGAWLEKKAQAMGELLREIVNIDSGTGCTAGINAVGATLARFLGEHGVESRTISTDSGNLLTCGALNAEPNRSRVLLLGHMDTVFPSGEAERRPFVIRNGRGYGPGVADMKAGLVMNCFVLAALRRYSDLPLTGLFTVDEEIGSPVSASFVGDLARNAAAVFNAEPGRPNGNVVNGRRGGVFLEFDIEGKAAHSGVNYAEGVSAIEELASKIKELHAIANPERGINTNVGVVSGGLSVNIIAPNAKGQVDVRYRLPDDRQEVWARISSILGTTNLPGTTISYRKVGEFFPVSETAQISRLLATYQESAQAHGVSLAGEFSNGCSDSGFVSAVGAPVLCGVGPVGGETHTRTEYVEMNSIVSRARILADAILRLAD